MYKQLTIIHPKIEGSKEYTFGYKLWVIKKHFKILIRYFNLSPFLKS